MAIFLEVNGIEYTNFTEASVTIALDALANHFTFQAVFPADEQWPLKGGDSCTVKVDGQLVLTGYIENIAGAYTAANHTLTVTGRDRTGDLIDSTVDVMDDLRAPLTLKKLIEKVVANIGSTLKVIDRVQPEPFNEAEDIVRPDPGDNAFMFVESYAQKRQVLLTSDAAGDIEITNSKTVPSGAELQNALGADGNNIVAATWSYDTTGLFRKYVQKGQLDPVALSFSDATSSDVESQQGEADDKNVLAGRQFVMAPEKSYSSAQLKKRAQWSKQIRRVRSTTYSCTVQGHTHLGDDIWRVNTTVPVFDEFADIDRELLINTVTFSYGANGSLTDLSLVEVDAYKLALAEPRPVGTNQTEFKL